MKTVGRLEGMFISPEAAATAAALPDLVEREWIGPDERVLLFFTGTGLKHVHLMS